MLNLETTMNDSIQMQLNNHDRYMYIKYHQAIPDHFSRLVQPAAEQDTL
jgi:hypothetical protein